MLHKLILPSIQIKGFISRDSWTRKPFGVSGWEYLLRTLLYLVQHCGLQSAATCGHPCSESRDSSGVDEGLSITATGLSANAPKRINIPSSAGTADL